MKYKYLLFDLDDTILSFKKSEDFAITKLCEYYNIAPTEENKTIYSQINISYWKMLERKEIERDELLDRRFIDFFNALNYDMTKIDSKKANEVYFSFLTSVAFEVPGAIETIEKLKEKYHIFIITNGIKKVQEQRMQHLPKLKGLFEKAFISEEIGYPKPCLEFANYVIDYLNANREEMLIIGDSLSSDIMLGINNNIDTVWFNPDHLTSSLDINYEIFDFKDLLKML